MANLETANRLVPIQLEVLENMGHPSEDYTNERRERMMIQQDLRKFYSHAPHLFPSGSLPKGWYQPEELEKIPPKKGVRFPNYQGGGHHIVEAETKKQSRPIVQGLANPRGVTAVYGTPIDWGSLPEKIRIGRRIANGRFKLEAHYPAKHFNDKKEYIDKRKAGSYCRFYDKKSPFFIARTVWDGTSQPGMHMVVKNRNETYRFLLTPKANDPTEATVIGAYLVHREDGVPVLCSGPIGELKAVGDDGDFKVTAYKKHGIRCPKKDSSGKDLAGEIPKTFGYIKRTSKKGPRKTAKDYCKPSHTFKHPTDIKRAEVVEEMDAYMDEQCTCLMCNWSGAYSDLTFLDDTPEGGPPGMDFMLVCPSCGDGDWLDDMMAEGYDEPCFSCDGIGTWDDGDCEYCQGSGMMSDTLRAEMAIYNSEYFDADCGCFKKAEASLVAAKHGYEGPPVTMDETACIFCGSMKDLHGYGVTMKDGSGYASALFQNICGECIEGYAAEGKSLSFMDWAKQEEASHLKKYGAEEPVQWERNEEVHERLKRMIQTPFHRCNDCGWEGDEAATASWKCPECNSESMSRPMRDREWEAESVSVVTCEKCGASAVESEISDMHFLTDGLCPSCDDEEGWDGGWDAETFEAKGDSRHCPKCGPQFPGLCESPERICRRCGNKWEIDRGQYHISDTLTLDELIVLRQKEAKDEGIEDWKNDSNTGMQSGRIQEKIWHHKDFDGPWDAESFEAETICDECEVNKATHRYNPLGTVLLCWDCLEKAEEDDGWNMIPKDEESLYAESFGAEEPAKDFLFVSFDVRDGEREYTNHTILPKEYGGSSDKELIEWMYGDVGDKWGDDYWVHGEMLVSVRKTEPITEDLKATLNSLGLHAESLSSGGEVMQSMADTFEAPYAGPGATMDIGKDTALSSFTPEELTTSSAIHGDFDQASLDYSGHQNIEVRADTAELTEEEIVEKNDKLLDVYYEVVSKNWTHMEYEDLAEYPDGENIIDGPAYIISDRFLLGRRSDADIKAQLTDLDAPPTLDTLIVRRQTAAKEEGIEDWKNDSNTGRLSGKIQEQIWRHKDFEAETERRVAYTWRMEATACKKCYWEIMEKHPDWEGKYDSIVADYLEGDFSPNFDEYCDEVMAELEGSLWESSADDWWFKDAESFEAETVQVYIDDYTEEETLDPTNANEDIGSFTILKEHFGECHPDADSCCDECLRLNGFDVVSDEEWERIKGAEYGKRQRFGNRYVARNTQGEFISNVGVGASLKADRRNKSKTPARSGFGNKGDSQKTPPVWAKPLGYVGALAAGWISASMIDNAKE